MDINLFKKIGFSDKSAKVYLVLLGLGPSSVRTLSDSLDMNRGQVYEVLKELQEKEVVRFYKEDTKQLFVADDPESLRKLIDKKEQELKIINKNVDRIIPELQALYNSGGSRPVAKYYKDDSIKLILEDVLEVCELSQEKMYRVYSAEGVREHLYEDFPSFSDARIAKNIIVKVIATGTGGELRGLDERKWLKQDSKTPTYIFIYPGKTAYISFDAKENLVGVIIENVGICETQKMIFDQLWSHL
ncbi:MAG: helix-turn-helix domain-containing protein [Candidatus Magasanikbacteria bacterium]